MKFYISIYYNHALPNKMYDILKRISVVMIPVFTFFTVYAFLCT